MAANAFIFCGTTTWMTDDVYVHKGWSPLPILRSWWRAGPFGQFLGIEARTSSTFEVLKLDAQGTGF